MKRHAWQARLGLLCAALLTLTLCLPLAAQAEGPKDMGPYLTGSTLSKRAAPPWPPATRWPWPTP